MKKVVLFCMTILVAMSLCVATAADPGWFVSSPSGNSAPLEVGFSAANDECTGDLVIVSYAQRDKLSAENRLKLEKAYANIVSATDITALNANIGRLAQEQGIAPTDLVVSDLFDLNIEDCHTHDLTHGPFDITLKAETLKGFVGLLHYNGEAWTLVQPARVEGDHLIFTVESMSPFAIVVNTNAVEAEEEEDNKIDPLNLLAYCSILGAAALSVIVLWKKSN